MNIEDMIHGIEIDEDFLPYVYIDKRSDRINVSLKKPFVASLYLECYSVIPGMCIAINEVDYVERYIYNEHIFKLDDDLLLLNYLIDGQCQIPSTKGRYMFIKKNDINIYIKEKNPDAFNHVYNAKIIHIIINKKQIKQHYDEYKEYYRIIDKIYALASQNRHITFESNEDIGTILQQINNLNETARISKPDYNKLKALELLLLTNLMKIQSEPSPTTYSDAQIRVVRKIKNVLSREITSYVSLDNLSATYGINLTTLKNCFKEMYGKPVYSWYRGYKFHRARELIKNTDYPISKIANMIGYKSSSKFSKAFKQEMGVLPSSYRKKKK